MFIYFYALYFGKEIACHWVAYRQVSLFQLYFSYFDSKFCCFVVSEYFHACLIHKGGSKGGSESWFLCSGISYAICFLYTSIPPLILYSWYFSTLKCALFSILVFSFYFSPNIFYSANSTLLNLNTFWTYCVTVPNSMCLF